MQRRIANEVDHAGVLDGVHMLRVVGVGAAQHEAAIDGDAQTLAPHAGAIDCPTWVLKGVGGRQHDNFGCSCRCDKSTVEIVVGGERAATE